MDGRKPYVGVKSEGFYSYGIWSPKNAPFVCLEPWAGRCDDTGFDKDISEKKGINAVQPGEIFEKGIPDFGGIVVQHEKGQMILEGIPFHF